MCYKKQHWCGAQVGKHRPSTKIGGMILAVTKHAMNSSMSVSWPPNLRRGCLYNRTHSHTFPYTNRNRSPFGMGTQQQEPVRFVCCVHSLMLRTHLVSVILFHVCFLLFGPIDPSKSLEASVSVSPCHSWMLDYVFFQFHWPSGTHPSASRLDLLVPHKLICLQLFQFVLLPFHGSSVDCRQGRFTRDLQKIFPF